MLYEMLASAATQYPEQQAIETRTHSVNYAELRAAVDRFASQLTSTAIQRGDPVVVLLPNGSDFVVSVFAIAKLGCIVVPVNLSFQIKELQFYLKDSAAAAVITTPELAAKHRALIQEVNPECNVITSVSAPEHGLSETGSGRSAFDGDVLYQYSSGSTGTPKRVVRTQSNLIHEADNYTRTVRLTRDDRILAVVPMFHAHGFGNCLLAAVRVGATIVALESFNRQDVLDALLHKGISVFPGVPFMFSILADSPSISGAELPALRLAFSAGAPLAQKTFDSFMQKFGVPVRQLYGST
jgi:long-chain acyl-CoA synthetase